MHGPGNIECRAGRLARSGRGKINQKIVIRWFLEEDGISCTCSNDDISEHSLSCIKTKYKHAIQPRPFFPSSFIRSVSLRVTRPRILIASRHLPFGLCGSPSRGNPSSSAFSGSCCTSKHISAATWQRMQAGSTGGRVYINIRRRPNTCLYKVRDDGPRMRKR
jgi:hypothetical protein